MEDLVQLLLQHGTVLLFTVTLAARAGAPVPAAPLLVVAGGLCALGQLSLLTTVVASLIANMLGDVVWFVAGRRYGYRVLGLLCRISLSPDGCVRQSEDLFGRWGGLSLVLAKFVPGVSLIAAPMAGALGMSRARFFWWNLAAASAWTAAFMALGAVFKAQIDRALSLLADAGFKALVASAVVAAIVLALYWLRRRRDEAAGARLLVSAQALADEIAQGRRLTFLDLRGRVARESEQGVPGSIAAELSRIEHAVRSMAKDEPIVTYCNCPNEASALMAAAALIELGFADVRVLAGGAEAWEHSGLRSSGGRSVSTCADDASCSASVGRAPMVPPTGIEPVSGA